jgi:peptidylprolyl isomerase/FKBP-type peptidyl-prolyl cis-trans isomerase FkpA
MSSRTLQVSIAVAAAIVVIVLFFIFNPFMQNTSSLNPAVSGTNSLVVQDEVVGTGVDAQPGDTVTVNYTGKLANGTVFDTSVGKAPFQFVLGAGNVIPGWDQGLVGMKVGGTRVLIIPPSLGYGSQDYGPIPANSTLTFEVELLGVTAASSTPYAPEGAAAN